MRRPFDFKMAQIKQFAPRSLAPLAHRSTLKPLKSQGDRSEARGTTAERGYGGWWQRESVAFRQKYSACAYCWLNGQRGPVEMVDHLYPHGLRRGVADAAAAALFRNKRYWVACCHDCHRSTKAATEAEGIDAIDALSCRLGLEPLEDPSMRRASALALTRREGV